VQAQRRRPSLLYVGASLQVIVRLATGATIQVSIANTGAAGGYAQGTPVRVHVPAEALRVLGAGAAEGNASDARVAEDVPAPQPERTLAT
jgi:hypothetical protein